MVGTVRLALSWRAHLIIFICLISHTIVWYGSIDIAANSISYITLLVMSARADYGMVVWYVPPPYFSCNATVVM